jgi:hypothetical protein
MKALHSIPNDEKGRLRVREAVRRWGWGKRLLVVGGIVLGAVALGVAGSWLFGRPSVSVSLSGALIRVDLGGIGPTSQA